MVRRVEQIVLVNWMCARVYAFGRKFGHNRLRRFQGGEIELDRWRHYRIIHGRHVGVLVKKDLDDKELKSDEISKGSY